MWFRRSSKGPLPLSAGPKVPFQLLRPHGTVLSPERAVGNTDWVPTDWGTDLVTPAPLGPRLRPTRRRWFPWCYTVLQGAFRLCPPVRKSPSNSSGRTEHSPVPEGPSGAWVGSPQHLRHRGWVPYTEKVASVGFRCSSGDHLSLPDGPKIPLQLRPDPVFPTRVSPPDVRDDIQCRKVRLGHGLDPPVAQGPRVGPTHREGGFREVLPFFREPPVSGRRSKSPSPTPPALRGGLQSWKSRR